MAGGSRRRARAQRVRRSFAVLALGCATGRVGRALAGPEASLQALRQRFVEAKSIKRLPTPGILAPWTDIEHVFTIVPHQLRRDIEQLEYLVSKKVLSPDRQRFVQDHALPEFRRVLLHVLVAAGGMDAFVVTPPQPQFSIFFALQGRAFHLHPGHRVAGTAVAADLASVQKEFERKEHRVCVVDDFFTPDALKVLQDYLLESTIWSQVKFGHVGTYLDTGFASALVSQIDEELRRQLPLLGGKELHNAWAYMYDGSLGGIDTHADDCQVQINFFISPSSANLWLENKSLPSGGLVLYGVGPPAEWNYTDYNSIVQNPRIDEILRTTNYWNVTIPYVENRAVLFDSTYFHKTDCMRFKKGYKNRRINVTFLYGRRKALVPAPGVAWSAEAQCTIPEEQEQLQERRERYFRAGQVTLDDQDWRSLSQAVQRRLERIRQRKKPARELQCAVLISATQSFAGFEKL
ncbi:unnamed protein product [Symbiodinium microadriaticum]|nr:unnamed protein product [Symbiodinium microadriaticum]CAE7847516.1 unnamed protein product [Symbiodinium sp. KB8]